MARVTYVKKAQPRYKTVPVLNEDGTPKKTPVMRRDGSQKMTKAKAGRPGRPIFMTVTKEDKTQPLPLRTCDHCGKPIEIGTAYKHVTPKSGPYGGRLRARHAECPTWKPWELSNSLSAQLSRVSDSARNAADPTDPASVAEALRGAAEEVRSIAEEKESSADNVEEGFGHETETSNMLRETAESLNTWADEMDEKADEIEGVEIPDEVEECGDCSGTGRVSGDSDDDDGVDECAVCGGSGEVDSDEYEDALSEIQEALDMVDESPV